EYLAKPGRFVSAAGLILEPRLQDFLGTTPYLKQGLFLHQFEGISHVLAGRHVVISTPTSSGKSLIFGVPVLNALARDRRASSLLIYPQKALANDQLKKLREMSGRVL